MKYIILLLLTFNSYAEVKMSMKDLRNNSNQGSDTFDNEADAIKRLTKIAKIKNGWRTGEFTLVSENSLYSKEFNVYNEQGLFTGVETRYYHPVNWNYTITPETQKEVDAKFAIQTKKARKQNLRDQAKGLNGKTKKDLNIKQLNEYLFN